MIRKDFIGIYPIWGEKDTESIDSIEGGDHVSKTTRTHVENEAF